MKTIESTPPIKRPVGIQPNPTSNTTSKRSATCEIHPSQLMRPFCDSSSTRGSVTSFVSTLKQRKAEGAYCNLVAVVKKGY